MAKGKKAQQAIDEAKKQPCIFCDNPAGSEEHAFPAWLLKFLKRATTGKKKGDLVEERKDGVFRHKGDKAFVVTYIVCDVCNKGWMRDLERFTSPLLKRIFSGKTLSLTATQQLEIAVWFFKTAMVFDGRTENHAQYFTREERGRLAKFAQGALPPPFPRDTAVWMATYAGTLLYGAHGSFLPAVAIVNSHPANAPKQVDVQGFTFTLMAGNLVLQLLTARLPPHEDGVLTTFTHSSRPWADYTVQIVPPSRIGRVRWPLEKMLDDASMSPEDFADRWGLTSHKPPLVGRF